jgi:hypothetical protein
MRSVTAALALVAALAMAAPASAQQPNRPVAGGDTKSVLAAVGLTFMNTGGDTGIGGAGNVLFNTLKTTGNGRIGIVGDVGFNHFSFEDFGSSILSLMGGARYTFTTDGKFVPYGEFLVGIVRSSNDFGSDTNFDPNIGFGVDVAWKPNLNFRGAVNFIIDDATATRWFFGISTPFKK